MKNAVPMEIETALKYMSLEEAIKMNNRRFFCNADETINTICEWAIRKQIPQVVTEESECPVCGNMIFLERYCPDCGQKIAWEDQDEQEDKN